jgi:tRNA nucleotidyltransferase (CCA-adding enzyme)
MTSEKQTSYPLSAQNKRSLENILSQHPLINQIIDRLHAQHARAYLVGGLVRDIMLGAFGVSVDIDIEVHGVTLDQLAEILGEFGPVNYVGKSFGVLKVGSADIDWSLPRTDSAGRKPQVQVVDLPIDVALRRRDLTMNALAIDLHDFVLHDPYGGLEDMQAKVLRSPDPTFFTQDPLRFYRVMQFIGRFEMLPDASLETVCKQMDISKISRERIEQEFNKLLLQSHQPSRGIRWLAELGRLAEILPEVAQLRGVEQDPIWHPEGDVFEHTMQAVDAAALLTYESDHEKLLIMYAALCHDLGKVSAMQREGDRIHNYGHDIASVPLARALLHRISTHKSLIDDVCTLVRWHMSPGQLVAQKDVTPAAYKRLAAKIAPLSLRLLALLAYADNRGRNPARGVPLPGPTERIDEFVKRAQAAGVFEHKEAPILVGADLLDVVEPGPELGKLLHRAYEMQLETGISDKAELKRRVLRKQ